MSTTVQEAAQSLNALLEPKDETKDEVVEEDVVDETTEEDTEDTTSDEDSENVEEGETEPEQTVQFLDELLEIEGYDPEQVNSLKIKTKIDGEQGDITFAELVADYQQGKAGSKRLDKAKELKRQLDDEITQHRQSLQDEYTQLNTLIQTVEADIESENLDELRRDDPAEYAVKIQERKDKLEKLKKVQAEAVTNQSQAILKLYEDKVKSERTLLKDAIPEWNDTTVASTEAGKVVSYLKGLGFRDEDISGKVENGRLVNQGLVDHRAFVIARKAMLFDELSQGKVETKKKLKPLPKLGAGKPKAKKTADVEKRQAKAKRLKKSGRVEDAASLINDLL